MDNRIILLGATGYTGALVLAALLRRGVKPILAGRDPVALTSFAERYGGLERIGIDVTKPATLQEHLRSGDILITTVGPFGRLGFPVAQAAADAGAHYIDSTGEVGFVHTLRERLHHRAQQTGAVMLPAFGYDYVPGILAGALAAIDAGDAVRALDIGYFATGSIWRGTSRGTRATIRDSLSVPSARWHRGTLVDERIASRTRRFNIRGRRESAFLVSGTEVLFLPTSFPRLEEVTVYSGSGELSRLALSTLAYASMHLSAARTVINALTRPLLSGTHDGPDAALRERTPCHIVAVASTGTAGNAPLSEVHLQGPNPYSLTGELMAWAAHHLATRDDAVPGVVGPTEAFGLETLRVACDHIGLRSA